jgi:hypothetical protein
MAKKLIVTSERALRAKYGEAGWKKIEKAVKALVKADQARGLETRLVSLDGTAGHGAKPGDAPSFKTAFDAAFVEAGRPEYALILGGPDVVPLQELQNPAKDDDPSVPSDLPYAGDAPAGDDVEQFVAPSRVVGRIPDLPGGKDPARLVALLERAAGWAPLTRKSYGSFFGLTAAEWKKSTTLSLQALFGKASKPKVSPKEGPKWKAADLSARAHFINCHGAPADAQFYGQSGNAYPVAHHSVLLAGRVKPGTVVAAECCYGAEVYQPTGDEGICTTYLDQGAIGFMGSTTVAYGPADSNGSADLVCRYFMQEVLGGASLGRAMLAARQRFAEAAAPISPIDLKTLAQFYLLGDPSLQAIGTTAAKAAGKPKGGKGVARVAPRAALESKAGQLARGLESVGSSDDGAAPADVAAALEKAAREAGMARTSPARTFEVRRPAAGAGPALESAGRAALRPKGLPTGTRFHVMFAEPAEAPAPRGGLESAGARAQAGPRLSKKLCLLAREVGGSVKTIERLWAHGPAIIDGGPLRRTGRQEARRRRLQERPRGGRPADGRRGARPAPPGRQRVR